MSPSAGCLADMFLCPLCCDVGFVQITLSANNMWGIIHMIVELLMKHSDGKYVMMKVRTPIVITAHAMTAHAVSSLAVTTLVMTVLDMTANHVVTSLAMTALATTARAMRAVAMTCIPPMKALLVIYSPCDDSSCDGESRAVIARAPYR